MTTIDLRPGASEIDELDAQVIGPVYAGHEPAAVAEATPFNLAVSHQPAVVVGAVCAHDVVAAVTWATAHGLPVAVQATGHGAVAPVVGAVLVSTARMRAVSIEPVRRTARVEAGARWREVIDAAAVHGLAPLSGSSSHVGVVGYTLGGGVGLLAREYGFAADLVTSVTMVTADGRLRVVDARSEPDLFWAVRGGKGNFGIVTEIEFELVPVTDLYAGSMFFPAADAAVLLRRFGPWAAGLPDRTTTSVALLRLPPVQTLPPELRGGTFLHLRYAHNGATDEAAALLEPMVKDLEPVVQIVGPLPYAATDLVHQDPTEPMPVWERSAQLREVPDDLVEQLLAQVGPGVESPLVMVEIRQLGGALGREPRVPNAVAGREGQFGLLVLGALPPGGASAVRAAGVALLESVTPWTTQGTLLNFLGDAVHPDEVGRAWPPAVLRRLLEIKDRVDPLNAFRFGHALR